MSVSASRHPQPPPEEKEEEASVSLRGSPRGGRREGRVKPSLSLSPNDFHSFLKGLLVSSTSESGNDNGRQQRVGEVADKVSALVTRSCTNEDTRAIYSEEVSPLVHFLTHTSDSASDEKDDAAISLSRMRRAARAVSRQSVSNNNDNNSADRDGSTASSSIRDGQASTHRRRDNGASKRALSSSSASGVGDEERVLAKAEAVFFPVFRALGAKPCTVNAHTGAIAGMLPDSSTFHWTEAQRKRHSGGSTLSRGAEKKRGGKGEGEDAHVRFLLFAEQLSARLPALPAALLSTIDPHGFIDPRGPPPAQGLYWNCWSHAPPEVKQNCPIDELWCVITLRRFVVMMLCWGRGPLDVLAMAADSLDQGRESHADFGGRTAIPVAVPYTMATSLPSVVVSDTDAAAGREGGEAYPAGRGPAPPPPLPTSTRSPSTPLLSSASQHPYGSGSGDGSVRASSPSSQRAPPPPLTRLDNYMNSLAPPNTMHPTSHHPRATVFTSLAHPRHQYAAPSPNSPTSLRFSTSPSEALPSSSSSRQQQRQALISGKRYSPAASPSQRRGLGFSMASLSTNAPTATPVNVNSHSHSNINNNNLTNGSLIPLEASGSSSINRSFRRTCSNSYTAVAGSSGTPSAAVAALMLSRYDNTDGGAGGAGADGRRSAGSQRGWHQSLSGVTSREGSPQRGRPAQRPGSALQQVSSSLPDPLYRPNRPKSRGTGVTTTAAKPRRKTDTSHAYNVPVPQPPSTATPFTGSRHHRRLSGGATTALSTEFLSLVQRHPYFTLEERQGKAARVSSSGGRPRKERRSRSRRRREATTVAEGRAQGASTVATSVEALLPDPEGFFEQWRRRKLREHLRQFSNEDLVAAPELAILTDSSSASQSMSAQLPGQRRSPRPLSHSSSRRHQPQRQPSQQQSQGEGEGAHHHGPTLSTVTELDEDALTPISLPNSSRGDVGATLSPARPPSGGTNGVGTCASAVPLPLASTVIHSSMPNAEAFSPPSRTSGTARPAPMAQSSSPSYNASVSPPTLRESTDFPAHSYPADVGQQHQQQQRHQGAEHQRQASSSVATAGGHAAQDSGSLRSVSPMVSEEASFNGGRQLYQQQQVTPNSSLAKGGVGESPITRPSLDSGSLHNGGTSSGHFLIQQTKDRSEDNSSVYIPSLPQRPSGVASEDASSSPVLSFTSVPAIPAGPAATQAGSSSSRSRRSRADKGGSWRGYAGERPSATAFLSRSSSAPFDRSMSVTTDNPSRKGSEREGTPLQQQQHEQGGAHPSTVLGGRLFLLLLSAAANMAQAVGRGYMARRYVAYLRDGKRGCATTLEAARQRRFAQTLQQEQQHQRLPGSSLDSQSLALRSPPREEDQERLLRPPPLSSFSPFMGHPDRRGGGASGQPAPEHRRVLGSSSNSDKQLGDRAGEGSGGETRRDGDANVPSINSRLSKEGTMSPMAGTRTFHLGEESDIRRQRGSDGGADSAQRVSPSASVSRNEQTTNYPTGNQSQTARYVAGSGTGSGLLASTVDGNVRAPAAGASSTSHRDQQQQQEQPPKARGDGASKLSFTPMPPQGPSLVSPEDSVVLQAYRRQHSAKGNSALQSTAPSSDAFEAVPPSFQSRIFARPAMPKLTDLVSESSLSVNVDVFDTAWHKRKTGEGSVREPHQQSSSRWTSAHGSATGSASYTTSGPDFPPSGSTVTAPFVPSDHPLRQRGGWEGDGASHSTSAGHVSPESSPPVPAAQLNRDTNTAPDSRGSTVPPGATALLPKASTDEEERPIAPTAPSPRPESDDAVDGFAVAEGEVDNPEATIAFAAQSLLRVWRGYTCRHALGEKWRTAQEEASLDVQLQLIMAHRLPQKLNHAAAAGTSPSSGTHLMTPPSVSSPATNQAQAQLPPLPRVGKEIDPESLFGGGNSNGQNMSTSASLEATPRAGSAGSGEDVAPPLALGLAQIAALASREVTPTFALSPATAGPSPGGMSAFPSTPPMTSSQSAGSGSDPLQAMRHVPNNVINSNGRQHSLPTTPTTPSRERSPALSLSVASNSSNPVDSLASDHRQSLSDGASGGQLPNSGGGSTGISDRAATSLQRVSFLPLDGVRTSPRASPPPLAVASTASSTPRAGFASRVTTAAATTGPAATSLGVGGSRACFVDDVESHDSEAAKDVKRMAGRRARQHSPPPSSLLRRPSLDKGGGEEGGDVDVAAADKGKSPAPHGIPPPDEAPRLGQTGRKGSLDSKQRLTANGTFPVVAAVQSPANDDSLLSSNAAGQRRSPFSCPMQSSGRSNSDAAVVARARSSAAAGTYMTPMEGDSLFPSMRSLSAYSSMPFSFSTTSRNAGLDQTASRSDFYLSARRGSDPVDVSVSQTDRDDDANADDAAGGGGGDGGEDNNDGQGGVRRTGPGNGRSSNPDPWVLRGVGLEVSEVGDDFATTDEEVSARQDEGNGSSGSDSDSDSDSEADGSAGGEDSDAEERAAFEDDMRRAADGVGKHFFASREKLLKGGDDDGGRMAPAEAVQTLQRVGRGYLCRSHQHFLFLVNLSWAEISLLQRVALGYQARKKMGYLFHATNIARREMAYWEKRNSSAITLQRLARGFIARQRVRQLQRKLKARLELRIAVEQPDDGDY